MGKTTMKFDMTGDLYSISITSIDEKALSKIRNELPPDFDMKTDNDTLNEFGYNPDFFYMEGFTHHNFELMVTVFENNGEDTKLMDIQTFDAGELLGYNKVKDITICAENGLETGKLYMVTSSRMNSLTWTGQVDAKGKRFDLRKLAVYATDFEYDNPFVDSFLMNGLEYNGKPIEFTEEGEVYLVSKQYDFVRYVGGLWNNRYEQVKLKDLLKDNFRLERGRGRSKFGVDRFKIFSRNRAQILQ